MSSDPKNLKQKAKKHPASNPGAVANCKGASVLSKPNEPIMPAGLSSLDQKLWDKCTDLYTTYKATQSAVASLSSKINTSLQAISQNRGSPQGMVRLCDMVGEQIKQAQRLHKERNDYVKSGCDKFDWYNTGSTEAQRRAAHVGELGNVDSQIKNLFDLRKRYCP